MKLTRFTMMFAAVACLVGCGQKSGASTESGNADESAQQTVEATSANEIAAQTEEPSTAEEEESGDYDLITSPCVFDGNRVVTKIKCNNNDALEQVYEYEYDGRGRLMIITEKWDNVEKKHEEYVYPTGDGFREYVPPESEGTNWKSEDFKFSSDEFGRITFRENRYEGGPEEEYKYNDKGQIVQLLSDGYPDAYTWDEKGRMVEITGSEIHVTYRYGDVENKHHQPFFIDSFIDFEYTSAVSYFPTSAVCGDSHYKYQYEFNEDGTLKRVTEECEIYKQIYEYTYGTL